MKISLDEISSGVIDGILSGIVVAFREPSPDVISSDANEIQDDVHVP